MQRIQILRLRLTVLTCLTVATLTISAAATAACVDPNTCYGTDVLFSNTTGIRNSGFGYQALYNNTTGIFNTASGYQALYSNTTGDSNIAIGGSALHDNTTGDDNIAIGGAALHDNTTSGYNIAIGNEVLSHNTSGGGNVAIGWLALLFNSIGDLNTAYGVQALFNVSSGSRNVALGYNAGYAITGSNNITIGAGQRGKPLDNGVIRIGSSTYQTKTHIAAIRGVKTGLANAVPVVIDATGQLGTINSSRRVKEDIQPMGNLSDRLLKLRPVTFHYKQPYEDGGKPLQFGLIAEEVAEAFPELVVYDEKGEPETVSYHLLATLLVNEFQAQATRITALEDQSTELAQLKKQVAMMAEVIERLDHERMVATNR